MITSPGGRYRVELTLSRAERLGPHWLVGAFAVTYPGADVVKIPSYNGLTATVDIRWRGGTGEINAGDQVSIMTEGMQLPGQAIPAGKVTKVEQIGELPTPTSLESGIPDSLKFTIAGGILLTVVYFSNKIQEKLGRAEPRKA